MNQILRKLNSRLHIPFPKLLSFMLIVTFIVQLAIISYNYFTAFIEIPNLWSFLFRLAYGTLLSTVAGFLLAYPDIFAIRFLNQYFPWNKWIFPRVVIQLILAIAVAITFGFVITLISHSISPYEMGLRGILTTNALISCVVNIIFMSLLEAWHFFTVGRENQLRKEELEQELSQIRFEVLKNQINPHFLFNSLNVLSSLIDHDTEKAQDFIDEFAHVYRYVLETIEKPLVPLSEELEFVNSYMFLQKIRYGNGLKHKTKVDSLYLSTYLPPLSLQLVLENAIKHNTVSESDPLTIHLHIEAEKLVVQNSLHRKISDRKSTGLGQENLKKRYALITDEHPEFEMTEDSYIVKLPLILSEE